MKAKRECEHDHHDFIIFNNFTIFSSVHPQRSIPQSRFGSTSKNINFNVCLFKFKIISFFPPHIVGVSYPNGREGETKAKCQTGWIQYFVMKRVMLYHKYLSAIFIGDVALNIICRFSAFGSAFASLMAKCLFLIPLCIVSCHVVPFVSSPIITEDGDRLWLYSAGVVRSRNVQWYHYHTAECEG